MATNGMQKWQRDHFVGEINDSYSPLIQHQELMLKSLIGEATEKATKKLAIKIGADKVINELEDAFNLYETKQAKARLFFNKTSYAKKHGINYDLEKDRDRDKLTPEMCRDQVREWASELAKIECEKTPEGKKLKILLDNKHEAKRLILEANAPDQLKVALNKNYVKVGLVWNREVKALPSVHN